MSRLLCLRCSLVFVVFLLAVPGWTDIVLVADNDDGPPGYLEVGNWVTGSVPGYDGGSYRASHSSSEPSTATFTCEVVTGGTYRVSTIFISSDNRSADALWTVHHRDGTETFRVDMTGVIELTEFVFGDYVYTTGTTATVTVTNQDTTGYVIADAVLFRMGTPDAPEINWFTATPPVPSSTDQVYAFASIQDDLSLTTVTVEYYTSENPSIQSIQAFDDGNHGDGATADGIYGALLPLQNPDVLVSYRFAASSDAGVTITEEKTYTVSSENDPPIDVFLFSGQSNASGRGVLDANDEQPDPRVFLFGNDYKWKTAREPIDDPVGQLDMVSYDSRVTSILGHSLALRAAKDSRRTSGTVGIIPCPLGGTRLSQWKRPTNPFDRSTLFGSMNFRRRIAAPGGIRALWWYQGESDASSSTYIPDHTRFVTEVREEMGTNLPIVYVQLAKHTNAGSNHALHVAAEKQRLMETGSESEWAIDNHFMAVAFDLPLGEPIHLNREALVELGRRVALATRQHVYGEPVEGTGPRLLRSLPLIHPGGDTTRVLVRFDQSISAPANQYDSQFRAFDDNGDLTISTVVRDPDDDRNVLITVSTLPVGSVRVSYGDVAMPGLNQWLPDVIKGTTGLPTPRFGPLTVEMPPQSGLEWITY